MEGILIRLELRRIQILKKIFFSPKEGEISKGDKTSINGRERSAGLSSLSPPAVGSSLVSLGAYQKGRSSVPAPDLLNQSLHLSTPAGHPHAH